MRDVTTGPASLASPATPAPGVSTDTVSRALSGHTTIAEFARRRIAKIASVTRYLIPHGAAATPGGGHKRSVAGPLQQRITGC